VTADTIAASLMVHAHMHGSAEWHVCDESLLMHALHRCADWHRLFIA